MGCGILNIVNDNIESFILKMDACLNVLDFKNFKNKNNQMSVSILCLNTVYDRIMFNAIYTILSDTFLTVTTFNYDKDLNLKWHLSHYEDITSFVEINNKIFEWGGCNYPDSDQIFLHNLKQHLVVYDTAGKFISQTIRDKYTNSLASIGEKIIKANNNNFLTGQYADRLNGQLINTLAKINPSGKIVKETILSNKSNLEYTSDMCRINDNRFLF